MDLRKELEGTNVIVIGGSSGIGEACVRLFAENRANVGFTFLHSHDSASKIMNDLASTSNITSWRVDLESDASMKSLAQRISKRFQSIHALVMCQGTIEGKSLQDYPQEAIRRVFDVNILSMIKMSRLMWPLMESGSSITCLSSISAEAGSYDPVYAASKGAILSFVKSIAREFGPKVRVNCVAPALTENTGMFLQMREDLRDKHRKATALKRLASPFDVATAVLFLSCSASRHITGVCLDVNGGEYLR